MPQISHLAANADPSAMWGAIDRDGGVIVDDFMQAALLSQMQQDFQPMIEGHRDGPVAQDDFWAQFHGTATKRITGLAGISKAWCQLLCDPRYKAMGDHYLDEDDYYLNTGQLICIGPGETQQILHRDELNWPDARNPDHEITITAIFALTDFTEENGATAIAPGSHLWPGRLPAVEASQLCQATMRAGSALLYSGKVIHGGGANRTSDQLRVGLHAGFVRGWLRSEENHQLTTTLEEARRLPERVQQLLGFRSYEPPMGGRLGLVNYENAADLL